MTDQERREKARRIAEAYCKAKGITLGPLSTKSAGMVMNELTDKAYDKLCWDEAMAVSESLPCALCGNHSHITKDCDNRINS